MFCIRCGTEIPEDGQACLYCGREDDPPNSEQTSEIVCTSITQPYEDLSLTELRKIYSEMHETQNETPIPVSRDLEENLKPRGFTIFSASGRLRRAKYLYSLLLQELAIVILVFGQSFASYIMDTTVGVILYFSYYPIILFLLIIRIITTIKRFHDINEPGSNYLMFLIPFYNFYVFFKLLFKDSNHDINKYGKYERRSWYWQVPVSLLIIPVVYLLMSTGFSVGNELLASINLDDKEQYYYNEGFDVGISFPDGWILEDMEGYTQIAHNKVDNQVITLEIIESDAPSFETISDAAFERYLVVMQEKKYLSESFGFTEESISRISCKKSELNSLVFIYVEFDHNIGDNNFRHRLWSSIYNGYVITMQAVIPSDANSDVTESVLSSINSFHMGNAQSGKIVD